MSRFASVVMVVAVLGQYRITVLAAEPITVNVTLDETVVDRPLSGRLFVYCSRKPTGEPRLGPDWFSPEPFFAIDIKNFKPGLTRVVDDRADGFPDRI
jgi:hypothetical protein